MTTWMVRAGRGAEQIDDFLEQGYVGVGFYREAREFNSRLMSGYEGAMRVVRDVITELREDNASLRAVQEKQAEKHLATVEAFEEIMSAQHERKLAEEDAKLKQKLATELAGDLKALLPFVAKRLMNVPITPGEAGHPLDDLANSFSPEQIEQMFGVMTETQRATFLEYLAGKAAKDKEADDDANGKTDTDA